MQSGFPECHYAECDNVKCIYAEYCSTGGKSLLRTNNLACLFICDKEKLLNADTSTHFLWIELFHTRLYNNYFFENCRCTAGWCQDCLLIHYKLSNFECRYQNLLWNFHAEPLCKPECSFQSDRICCLTMPSNTKEKPKTSFSSLVLKFSLGVVFKLKRNSNNYHIFRMWLSHMISEQNWKKFEKNDRIWI